MAKVPDTSESVQPCIFGGCPLASQYALAKLFYCATGAED